MSAGRHIVIEGPIGVGKSSFARLLAERLGARLALTEESNPINASLLDAFYSDRSRYGLQVQLTFLLGRWQKRDELRQEGLFQRGVVTDWLFQRDRLFAQLNLSSDELALYDKIYALLGETSPRPDLVVYLQARTDVLFDRLRKASDKRIPRDYVSRVNEAYADFFFHFDDAPLLVVNTSEIDFVNRREDFDDLVAVIQRTKSGVHHYSPLGAR